MAGNKREQLLFSVCSGYNYYTVTERRINILGSERQVIRHYKTGEEYFIAEVAKNDFYLDRYISIIRRCVSSSHIEWPIDIVKFNEEYYLVFSFVNIPRKLFPLKKLLTDDVIGDNIKYGKQHFELVSDFLDAMIELDEGGYAFYGLSDDDCIYYFDNRIFLSFKKTITSKDHPFPLSFHSVDPQYADPYFFTEKANHSMDYLSMYHTVSVILFRLLIGKLPYDGSIMASVPDRGEYEWINYYHGNSIYFIFGDESDSDGRNKIGVFASDEMYIERWNKLSPEIQDFFTRIFQHKNAMRESTPFYITPRQWKEIFTGWSDGYLNNAG